MLITRVARRYATAIYEAAFEAGELDAFFQDVRAFQTLLAASRELRQFFQSPIIAMGTKHAVIDELCGTHYGDRLKQALRFLVEKRREQDVEVILEALVHMRRDRLGVAMARITSARPLSDGERTALEQALARVTGKSVESEYAVDPGLLGGVVARVGDTVYDGTVSRQLRRLRAMFAAGI